MDLEQIVRERYSCRRYSTEPVATQTIRRILEIAQRTPSWCNCQPWRVLLVSGEAIERFRNKLYAHAAQGNPTKPDFPFPLRYEGVYRERRKVCGVQLYQALGIGREDKASAAQQSLENFRFFGAPHVALITTEEDLGVYGAVDCGLYVSNFMLAAHNLGVASIAQAALASYPDFIRDHFGLPPNRKFVCGISFGYADPKHPINTYRTARVSETESTTWIE
ncbi:MAG: nitroreductase [Betaproteobacteria bacterium]|nr:nitroreductase [Betaproteobacteria bacterium]